MKYKIKSQLSEKQIEKDFSNFMGFISALSGKKFRLIDVNEQETGSDALLNIGNAILPMYIQFKVSEGIMTNGKKVPKAFKVIKNIADFRQSESLTDDPILYFKLRDLAKNATDYQHNVLLKHNGNRSLSFYLAPLTLRRDNFYDSLVSNHDFIYWHYWREIHGLTLRHMINLTPGFKSCVTITPHSTVESADHYYSYSMTGSDICFHSPEIIQRGVSRLSDNFYNYINMARESGFESFGDLEKFHTEEMSSIIDTKEKGSYLSYCKSLYENYGISTYILGTFR